MTIEERRSTAVHEAGHVVVAWTLGVAIGSMTIGRNGDDTAGGAEIGDFASLPTLDRVAVLWAGCAAQELFGCEAPHELASLADAGEIQELLAELPDDQADRLRSEGYDRATQILRARRSLIERFVAPLTLQGRLSQEAVEALLSRP